MSALVANRNGSFESQMRVFCLLSDMRVSRSQAPQMYSAVLQKAGINGVYVPFHVEPEGIGHALQSLRVLHIAGANVSVPYKETVLPHMDDLSEGARFIGAINTIVRRGRELKGYNTNANGFMDALDRAGIDVRDKAVLVFGAGAAARAVVFVLNWLHARPVYVAARSENQSRRLVASIGGQAHPLQRLETQGLPVDIVVNTMSVSSRDESPEMAQMADNLDVPGCRLVVDLNYGRPRNFWQEMAQARGIRFIDGLPLLACQARRSFALWTGLQVDPAEFLKAAAETTAL
jgi:shikimate dehydrogenase